jgi:hypothetical protein
MKQGPPMKSTYEPKTEPKSKAVDICSVSQLGEAVGNRMAVSKELYAGRGYEAPKNSSQSRKSGSQGRY